MPTQARPHIRSAAAVYFQLSSEMAKLDNLNETPYVDILTLDELDLKKKKGCLYKW